MLFGKYHIVIFREGSSGSRNMRMRGWFCVLVVLVFTAVLACNVWLWREWLQNRHLRSELEAGNRQLEEQRRRLSGISGRIDEISEDLERVRNFDAKLRIMMNMEKDVPETSGPAATSFARTYVPMHRQELAVRKIQEFLSSLQESARLEEVVQQDLLRALREHKDTLASLPTIWPTNGFISSSFGSRSSPFGGGRVQFHKGMDISARSGTPVVATAEGTVQQAGRDGAYGNSVEVNHGSGLVTKYAHMQRFVVEQGQWVRRGQVVGYVGMTGRATGPHLHYEVRLNGVPVNPMRYILD
ncbi:M23 family metallopeptidase [uncultured Desulfovibrio sp.]|uniref:M23 family metallopeptidase n=1 Tax=uncultured Desulfovibrio sp. TaxID=167968 RepID=UPI001C3B4A42|nr:M23 family metallopeptidase [uncultured Desulfovibrio sp.]HIX41144.1 peptidoglycan DD-metalloendopeptidase family protein [Candidatus Desulfovibrio intestinigallinarum]